jgi:uncharacterized membrane protein YhaH (DUF805 family)
MKQLLWALLTVLCLLLTGALAGLGALAVKALLRGQGEVTGLVTKLTWLLVWFSCLLTFDKRLAQAKRNGVPLERELPTWVNILPWAYYALFLWMAVLDWKWAVGLYAALFVLSVLRASEMVGNLLWGQILWQGTGGFRETWPPPKYP